MREGAKWEFWIDRGGTFTDGVFIIETPGGGGYGQFQKKS